MYTYNIKLDRVIDGDTIDANIDLGFDISVKKRIRFLGINTPESRTRDLEEKASKMHAGQAKTVKSMLGKLGPFKMKSPMKCWKTHKQAGYKKKNGRTVPNCIPK